MKWWHLPLIIFVLAMLTSFKAVGASENSITVEVTGIEVQEGRISIGLFNHPDDFPRQRSVFQGKFVEITGGTVRHVFEEIPAGTYAIAVYHDINGNGKLDVNFLKIPREPFGFSRNARPSFGPPDFDDAAFAVDGAVEERIQLQH